MGSTDTPSADRKSAEAEGPRSDPFWIGTITDAYAFTGCYKVIDPNGISRPAIQTVDVSATPLGATELSQLMPGDSVLCYAPAGYTYCLIIKVVPATNDDPRFQGPDSIVLQSVGFMKDKIHSEVYENTDNRLVNASMGRPIDTLPGDWGYINELGAMFFLGKIMATMRASDRAKIEAYYGDDLLRIVGFNLQTITAAMEKFQFNDEGECSEVSTTTPFMWESCGLFEPGEDNYDKNEGDAGGITSGNENAFYEPKEKKQVMVFRGLDLGGYLGDISREQVVMYPDGESGVAKQDEEYDFRGLSEVHRMLDGTIALRSAKQIILEKSLMLPVPWQKRDPDDPEGDHAADPSPNYKAANYYGSGDAQEKKAFEWSDDENPMIRNNELWEQEEYLFGKYGLQAIDAHEEDWYTAEATDIQMDSGTENKIDPALFDEKLEFAQFKNLPEYAEIKIDQRDEYNVRYYRSRSSFHMLDDGSIIIEDGYGSQIVMSGGNITTTCQGDIWQRPGRSAITWAPRDIIQRAGWCAELTAAKKDVRIKGENNVHVFAGDGEKGNILLECRSTDDPSKAEWEGVQGEDIESKGIILKCKDGAIDLWSNYRVFAGASKDEEGIVELSSGSGRTTVAGKEVGIEATTQFGVAVANRPTTGSPAQFGMDQNSAYMLVERLDIGGDVGVWQGTKGGTGLLESEDNMQTKASVKADGSMICDGTMTANKGMITNSIYNGEGEGDPPEVEPRGGEVAAEAEKQKQLLFLDFDTQTLDSNVSGQGNAEVQDAVGFSFRKSKEHYKIEDDFRVVEARWQQMYRAFGVNSPGWDEPVVKAPDGSTDTRPHPGQKAWETQQLYSYLEPSSSDNVVYSDGQADTRERQSGEAPTQEEKTLKDEYVINVQES